MIALPKTNAAPKMDGWKMKFPIGKAYFQGIYMLVLGRVCFYLFIFFVALIPVLMTRLSLMFRMLVGASFFSKIYKLHCTPTFFFVF